MMMPMELAKEMLSKDLLCPFCGLSRSLRSDYVRCNPCGRNWWIGTDLSRNPHAKPALTGSLILKLVKPTGVLYMRTDPKSGMSEEVLYDQGGNR